MGMVKRTILLLFIMLSLSLAMLYTLTHIIEFDIVTIENFEEYEDISIAHGRTEKSSYYIVDDFDYNIGDKVFIIYKEDDLFFQKKIKESGN